MSEMPIGKNSATVAKVGSAHIVQESKDTAMCHIAMRVRLRTRSMTFARQHLTEPGSKPLLAADLLEVDPFCAALQTRSADMHRPCNGQPVCGSSRKHSSVRHTWQPSSLFSSQFLSLAPWFLPLWFSILVLGQQSPSGLVGCPSRS